MRKVQEKKEERGRQARDRDGETEGEGQEPGVVGSWHEKRVERKSSKEVEEKEKGADIDVLAQSVRSLSL